MAKHLDKFAAPYRESRIPFLLGEPLTDGSGEMVDFVFRYANAPACALLNLAPAALTGKRFTRLFPAAQLRQLSPLQTVAFSGSTAAVSYCTVLGQSVQLICYQPMYGLVACILDQSAAPAAADPGALLTDQLPGTAAVLEVSRAGIRFLSFSRQLCLLTGREHRELLDFYADDLSSLVVTEDWGGLLQALLDAVRSGQPMDHTFRLLRKDETTLWVNLRAELLTRERGVSTFSALLLDVQGQYRAQERQAEALRQAEQALSHYANLFNGLPSGYCVLRQTGNATEALYVSQGLSALLGFPAQTLLRQLAEDPLRHLPAADRAHLTEAAAQCRAEGTPLRRICRLRTCSGDVRWGLIEAVRQEQPDGSSLLLAACTDVTGERAAVSELEFHAKLCDLLLDDPRIISFDYDPDQDVCRIFRRDRESRRTTRTIPEYLRDLERSTVIHPEDQSHLAAAFRRASTHPTTDVVEYRANYDGQGWRWYRVSWVSLFDSKGDVYRLVGKAEDITRRKAAAQRFQELKNRLKKADNAVLAAVQLDLAGDRILDAHCPSQHLTQVLFGNTASDFWAHMKTLIPTEVQQAAFSAQFTRETLLSSFHQGHLHIRQEHRFSPGDGAAIWVETTAELIEDPDTRRTAAFCTIRNIDALHRQSLLLHALAARDYDLVLAVSAVSGHCLSYGRRLNCDSTYAAVSSRYSQLFGQAAPTLEAVQQQLAVSACWSAPLGAGSFSWLWLDEDDQVLLLTLRDTGVTF